MVYSFWDNKDPADFINPATMDFSALLPTGATLVGSPVFSASPSGLILGASAVSGSLAFVQVSGGVSGASYTVRCSVTDSQGNIWNRSTNSFLVTPL
jgi:hypothetical protein